MTESETSERRLDPRWFQIGALLFLLSYGLFWLRFELAVAQVVVTLSTVLFVQHLCTALAGLTRVEWKSALISGLSLSLLFRADSPGLIATAASAAIASKFLFRWNGRHIFNPTNFGIVLLLILFPHRAWVSPGQWGSFAFFAFLMLCLGSIVINRAGRTDVTLAFLGFYITLLCARSLWLNEPLSIPLHKLENGALLLFAFFMISDPKTTPDSRAGRIIFAGLVALGAAYVQFRLFRNNGLLWSLACCSLSVPFLNRLLPASGYQWNLASRPARPNLNSPFPTELIYENVQSAH